jgi:hypothetical protein
MTTATTERATEAYSAVAGQTREATEKSLQVWKDGVSTVADRMTSSPMLPKIDLTEPVERYFEYVQRAVDLNRDLATRWAELVTTMTGSLRGQVEQAGTVVKEQAENVTEMAAAQVRKAEDVARQQAEEVEKAEKEQIRLAKQAERQAAKEAHAQAREPYEGLTKAELSDLLAQRELPKSGNIEELIERLVDADSD